MKPSWVQTYLDSARASAVHQQPRVTPHPGSAVAQLAFVMPGTRVAIPPGMSTHLRLVPAAPAVRATTEADTALRPVSFDDYIGQAETIANLRQSVSAAKRGGWQLDHMLFAGPAGLGKTSLACVIAAELGGKLRATSAPAIEHKGALASLLTTLEEGDVLFIDEIHALDRKVAECLYLAMEDRVIDMPAGKRVIRVPLPKFTLLAATTHAGKLPKPLLDRFGFVWQLKPYTLPEMATIVTRAAGKLDVAIDEEGAIVIARASRGTPRIANRLLRRVRDAATNAVHRWCARRLRQPPRQERRDQRTARDRRARAARDRSCWASTRLIAATSRSWPSARLASRRSAPSWARIAARRRCDRALPHAGRPHQARRQGATRHGDGPPAPHGGCVVKRHHVVVASAIRRQVEKFSDRRLDDGDDVWRERELELRAGVARVANEIAKGFSAEDPRTFKVEKFAEVCGLYISFGRDNYSDCYPGEVTWEKPAAANGTTKGGVA